MIFDGTEHRRELFGGERSSTNNRMEMMGAIMALESLREPCEVILMTDSKYLKNGITKWIKCWKARGWTTKEREPVKNRELWERLDALNQKHRVTWKWVPGHSGISGNEQADRLANRGKDLVRNEAGGMV